MTKEILLFVKFEVGIYFGIQLYQRKNCLENKIKVFSLQIRCLKRTTSFLSKKMQQALKSMYILLIKVNKTT